jgi:hypothetical protein
MEPSAQKGSDLGKENLSASGKSVPDTEASLASAPQTLRATSPTDAVTRTEFVDFIAFIQNKFEESERRNEGFQNAIMLELRDMRETRVLSQRTPSPQAQPQVRTPTLTEWKAPLFANVTLKDKPQKSHKNDKKEEKQRNSKKSEKANKKDQNKQEDDDDGEDQEDQDEAEDDDDDDEEEALFIASKKKAAKKSTNKKKKTSRKSDIHHLADQSDNPRATVQYTQLTPSYDHIKLTKLSVDAIRQFIDDVIDYQTVYGLKVPVSMQIDRKIRRSIIARTDGLTSYNIHTLTTQQLFALLQESVRPASVLEFQRTLTSKLHFPAWQRGHKPTAIDFRRFYDAVIEYIKDFLTLFEVLAEDNEDNIPAANRRPDQDFRREDSVQVRRKLRQK